MSRPNDDDLQPDAVLRRMLANAPDAELQPREATRAAILKAAHEAVGGATAAPAMFAADQHRESKPKGGLLHWLDRLLPRASAPWGAAFATVVLASFITLMWHGEPVPDGQPDSARQVPVPERAAPAAPAAESTASPPVAPANAPAGSDAPPSASASPAEPDVSSERPAPRTSAGAAASAPASEPANKQASRLERATPAQKSSDAAQSDERRAGKPDESVAVETQRRARPAPAAERAREAEVLPPVPAPAQPAPAPAEVPAPAVERSRIGELAAAPPAAPAPPMASRAPASEPLAQQQERAHVARPAAPPPMANRGAAAGDAPAAMAAPAAPRASAGEAGGGANGWQGWTDLRMAEAGGASHRLGRAQAGDLAGALGAVMPAATAARTDAALPGAVDWRVTLERQGRVLGTLELGGSAVRWHALGAAPVLATPSPAAMQALRQALERATASAGPAPR